MPAKSLTCPFCQSAVNWGCQGKHGYATCSTCRAAGDVTREHIGDTPHWAPGFPKARKPTP